MQQANVSLSSSLLRYMSASSELRVNMPSSFSVTMTTTTTTTTTPPSPPLVLRQETRNSSPFLSSGLHANVSSAELCDSCSIPTQRLLAPHRERFKTLLSFCSPFQSSLIKFQFCEYRILNHKSTHVTFLLPMAQEFSKAPGSRAGTPLGVFITWQTLSLSHSDAQRSSTLGACWAPSWNWSPQSSPLPIVHAATLFPRLPGHPMALCVGPLRLQGPLRIPQRTHILAVCIFSIKGSLSS